MALQAQYLTHDPRAVIRPVLDEATVFLGDAHLLQSRGNTAFRDPRSELTCNNNNGSGWCFMPRKRARVGDLDAGDCRGLIMDSHGGALPPPVPQAFTAAGDSDVESSRENGSGAASTTGRAIPVASQGLVSQLHRHGVEIDSLVRIQNERLRVGLQEARRRHARAVVSALERTAARRLRAAEADLECSLARGAELEEELRQMAAEGEAWRGVASGHEAAAARLRATIDQLLQPPPCAEGEAEDAQSCCFVEQDHRASADDRGGKCRACGEAGACVLLLPCRHLCLCVGCEAAADACPVCAATKNATLHVLLS